MEQIEAKDFLFYYNPNLEELIVSSGLKFMKINDDGFKVDLNPHGQSELTTVDFINLDINKRSLVCSIGKEPVIITINTCFHINVLGFKVVIGTWKNIQGTKDLDKIDLFFTGDKLEHLYISKVKDYNIIDSIRIFNEENRYFVVKNKPQFTREVITKLSLCNETIKIETESNNFDYKLDVNEDVLSFLHSAFKLIKLSQY
ncbi:MAG: hypothetical protein ACTTJJ_05055 [Prevotella fusca]|uniref:hypothetical protein n=1 Tax=Prevotella fusca TaxID=589436 RepID=UPI003FA067C2